MKIIFGFFTGAVVGAGSLFGLRKVLTMMDSAEEVAPVSTTSPKGPASPEVFTSSSKAAQARETSRPGNTMNDVSADLDKAQEPISKLEEQVSMVGEPAARHQEPIAATESAPEAVSPRSETTEDSVPEKVKVKPASTAPMQSKNGAKAPVSENNGARKPPRASRPARTDDFTDILDIGPVFNQKLHDAGIRSYKDLAKLTPAQIEEKTGIPAERIERGQWLEQVHKILASKTKD